jgi:hypothetical protein
MKRAFGPRLVVTLIVILAAAGITTKQVSLVFPAIAFLALGGIVAWHRSVLGAVVGGWILILLVGRLTRMPAGIPAADIALIGVLVFVAMLGANWAQRLSEAMRTSPEAPEAAPAVCHGGMIRMSRGPRTLIATRERTEFDELSVLG